MFYFGQYYYNEDIEHLTDIFAIFVFSILGSLLLVSFKNLTMLFLGTEILSIPLYILAASNRKSMASNEAGLKYYLMGSFATCFLLLDITLIYGVYEIFDLGIILAAIVVKDLLSLFITGILLILRIYLQTLGGTLSLLGTRCISRSTDCIDRFCKYLIGSIFFGYHTQIYVIHRRSSGRKMEGFIYAGHCCHHGIRQHCLHKTNQFQETTGLLGYCQCRIYPHCTTCRQ